MEHRLQPVSKDGFDRLKPVLHFERLILAMAVFIGGGVLMALEVVAFRIIGRVVGTALRETTTVIAVFMAAMSIGYWAGGKVADRWPSRRTLAAMLLFAAASMSIVPQLDRVVASSVTGSQISLAFHALIISMTLFFLPTVFLATVSPIGVRLFTTATGSSGRTAGSISALSTIGSIAGSVACAFVLLDWLKSINRIVLVLAIVTFATALLVLLFDLLGGARSSRMLALVAAVAIVVGSMSLASSGTAATQANGNLLFERDSAYHHVTVWKHGLFRVLKLDFLTTQTSMSVADPHGPGLEYEDYHHFVKAINPDSKSILLIGLGGGTAAKQFLRIYPDVTIDAAEIDPMVVEAARRFFHVEPSARLRIHTSDGRMFVKRSRETWDVISVDSFTTNRYGSTIPPHLVTREFFEEAKSHLNPGGVFQFHCYRTVDAPMSRALARTLAQVFPQVIAFPGSQFTELFAMTTPVAMRDIVARTRPLRWRDLRRSALKLTTLRTSNADPILTDDYAAVDSLLGR